MAEERKGGLVVPDRPQISVEMSADSYEIIITVAGVAPDFEHIEHNEVHIPAECAEQVAKAILDLLKQ